LGDLSKNWDMSQFLDKTKLTRGGQITRAAILLLGKPEAAHFLLPNPAQITWKLDSDDKAYEHFGPPFLITVEDIFQRIRNTKFRIQPFNRLIPYELTKYDSGTVLEALNNCLAHQDYSQNARMIITEKMTVLYCKISVIFTMARLKTTFCMKGHRNAIEIRF